MLYNQILCLPGSLFIEKNSEDGGAVIFRTTDKLPTGKRRTDETFITAQDVADILNYFSPDKEKAATQKRTTKK